MSGVLDELRWRGLIENTTDEEALAKQLATSTTLYCGFDPTADSLHVGNLVPLLVLRRFQLHGHSPIALAGGATGSIGDPSGKSAERQLLARETLEENIAKVKVQLARLLNFETTTNPAQLLDNATWTADVSYLDFLRDIGKHFSVTMMVAKESVRTRMQDRESGISYTEFSYMLLQAFDFYHLRANYNCALQIGGSEQWGNITAGIDLSRKKLGATIFGLTLPLITNSDGSKFGKTAAGAVWLDPNKTSVYRFYQFWIRTDDRDAIRYLKYFTFLSQEAIRELEVKQNEAPERRIAQKALAKQMTTLIHGEAATQEAVKASEILFGGDLDGITETTFNDIINEVPSIVISKANLNQSYSLADLVVEAKLCPSKGQARKDIAGGGINLNNVRQSDPRKIVASKDLLFDRFILLRKGKKNYTLASFE
ncbi:MAG: Tyrosine--tRNA ligase [Verrucomicrobia subdivision 3 bacterium]|nr:Tyrosine--tRNA ligase [Limisphaerales bacterium]MCS1416303.1 Tyrosine--tRNA ligase [Limisphaerales bacterium]